MKKLNTLFKIFNLFSNFLFYVFLAWGCENSEAKGRKLCNSESDAKFNCIEYLENGEIKKYNLINDTLTGDYEYYHANGNIIESGYFLNGEKLGWISYFNDNGDLIEMEHYTFNLLPGKSIVLNQYVLYENNKINLSSSHFYEIEGKDTIASGDRFHLVVKLTAPYHRSKMKAYLNFYRKGFSDLTTKPAIEFIADSFMLTYESEPIFEVGEHGIMGYVYDYKDTIVNGQPAEIGRKLFVTHSVWVVSSNTNSK